MTNKDPYLVPGLVRGLAALQAFTPHTPELTLSQLARELGVTRSAAFRTVHTLVQEGFLLASKDGHKYRIGPVVLRLSYGYLASRDLLEVAHPALENLRNQRDWSTQLGVLDGKHVLYLIRLPASDGTSSLVQVGSRLPAATTAMGRVLLGRLEESDIRHLFADQPSRTLTQTLKNWETDRQATTLIHVGTFESGMCSVAAPIFDSSGQIVAAISATKSTDRIPKDVERSLTQAATAISTGLGWPSTT